MIAERLAEEIAFSIEKLKWMRAPSEAGCEGKRENAEQPGKCRSSAFSSVAVRDMRSCCLLLKPETLLGIMLQLMIINNVNYAYKVSSYHVLNIAELNLHCLKYLIVLAIDRNHITGISNE
jgi:hypothetical protein